jgi:hypothetical protein
MFTERTNDHRYLARAHEHLRHALRPGRLNERWQAGWNAIEQLLRSRHAALRTRFVVADTFNALVDATGPRHFAAAVACGAQSLPPVLPILNQFRDGTADPPCEQFIALVAADDCRAAAKALLKVIKLVRDHRVHGFKTNTERDRSVLLATLPPLIELAKAAANAD